MSDALEAESYRMKADALLKEAAAATNLNERSRLIDEAASWHFKALAATGTHLPSGLNSATQIFLDLDDETPSLDA